MCRFRKASRRALKNKNKKVTLKPTLHICSICLGELCRRDGVHTALPRRKNITSFIPILVEVIRTVYLKFVPLVCFLCGVE